MNSFWKNKNVLITGHNGFKGSWLSLWLTQMEANVFGFSLPVDTNPSLFEQLKLKNKMQHKILDICNFPELVEYINNKKIDFVFHFAAQSLVLRGYKNTLTTWNTNVLGTANLLEALRYSNQACSVIAITTDKVYENNEWPYAYRETDRLGGKDPYSASKAGSELVINSYRSLFFQEKVPIKIATARAGNVIGGGDWCENRLMPDIARSIMNKIPLKTRNPNSVRPWQHVLEPLAGYLLLAEKLSMDGQYASAFNFGPSLADNRTVEEVIKTALKIWPGDYHTSTNEILPHEAGLLKLSIDKARSELQWQPKWGFDIAVKKSIEWYQQVHNGTDPVKITLNQIKEYNAT